MVQVAQLIGSHREYRFFFSTEGDFKWYKKSIESNKENIKNKCEIVFKEAGDQVKIDENKVKSIHLLYQNLKINTLILVWLTAFSNGMHL